MFYDYDTMRSALNIKARGNEIDNKENLLSINQDIMIGTQNQFQKILPQIDTSNNLNKD